MDKQIITFSANEQNLVRIGGEYHYSSNKVSYIGAHFDLGANWDGFDSVRAVWFTDRINGISTVLDGEGNCTVPTEVLKKKDRVFVNLVGSIVSNGELTDRLTTYPAVALVVDSKAKVDSTETAPVTPSQFEQFASIVQDAVANIKDIVSTTLNADYTLTFVYSDGTSYTTPSIRGERGPQGADGADGTDGNGIASAVLNSNYTLTLTFTDGTSYTTPSIRGAQGPKGDPGDVSQAQLDAAVSDLKSDIDALEYAFKEPESVLVFDNDHYCDVSTVNITEYYDDGFYLSRSDTRNLVIMFVFPTEVGKTYNISYDVTQGICNGGGLANNPTVGTKPSYVPTAKIITFDTGVSSGKYSFTATGAETLLYFGVAYNSPTFKVENATCYLSEVPRIKEASLPDNYATISTINVDIGNEKILASGKPSFTVANKCIKTDGTIVTENSRNLTDYIPLNGCTSIKYGLTQFLKSSSEIYNTISFYTDQKVYISGTPSKYNGFIESITGVPQNAAYVVGSFVMQDSTNTPYIVGVYDDGLTSDTASLLASDGLNGEPSQIVVSPTMNIYDFVSAINNKWTDYATLCRCKPWSFMKFHPSTDIYGTITIDDYSDFCELLNKNFRAEVANPKYSFAMNCNRINNAFERPIIRFMDARLNTSNQINFSLPTGTVNKVEPSVIVSDDMTEMSVYAYMGRIKTKDGINWSAFEPLVYTGNALIHVNISKIDDTYYLFGCESSVGGAFNMMTSTDGINFTTIGSVFLEDHEFVSGKPVLGWGNSTIIKDPGSGTYYLYVEYTTGLNDGWEISLVTATDLTTPNEDGTIGNWTSVANNPILTKLWLGLDGRTETGAGNPDFVKGVDNRPVKYNNRYYMLVHSTHPQYDYNVMGTSNILRLSSEDLETWTVDGILLDNRDTPTDGDNTSGNADHCIIEFKGRTYLFYSWNINHTDPSTVETVKYMIDDRPITKLLEIRP